ncbi:LamG domain-containing protein [Pseudokineococcus marinus]|uniref:Concanavalin A-like lectin/glucanases superfamily protein n=1 Tax=Pseudokineococcus marinus TaxID=351215 RepID=A0A849BQ51_9ACTN|nr:LamG domain-containing protein [Pseudokineococcus marinus]NNH21676.1 hypothetical protein [Pseudokineococcus marinus]
MAAASTTLVLSSCSQGDPVVVPSMAPETAVGGEAGFSVDLGGLVPPLVDGAAVSVDVAGGNASTVDAVLRVAGAVDGLALVDGPLGATALQMPARCEDPETCGRAVVEVPAELLPTGPGTGAFHFGAEVQLTEEQTSMGANVLQRGFSTGGGGQWKVQVDGLAGQPSCVVADSSGSGRVLVAKGKEGVADGSWHELECRRADGSLALSVDGGVVAEVDVPPGVDVAPGGPVRVGGKNLRFDNDPYLGAVARVWFDIDD